MSTEDVYGLASAGPAQRDYLRARGEHSNWLYVMLAGAGLILGSSIAGVLVFDWYFDCAVGGLAHSLRPISKAFHEMSGERLRLELSRPAN